MGSAVSSSHEAVFDKDRFDHTINILKEYESKHNASDKYNVSVQRCYDEKDTIQHSQTDYMTLEKINSDITNVIDKVSYFLTHFQIAQSIPNYKFITKCSNKEHMWLNACDSTKQLHFILHHTTEYILSRHQRRSSRFTQQWRRSETDTKQNDIHTYAPTPTHRPLPETPVKHHQQRSASLTSLADYKTVFMAHNNYKPALPAIDNIAPLIPISYTSSHDLSIELDDIQSPSEPLSPPKFTNKSKSAFIYNKKPLPPTPTTTKLVDIPGLNRLKRERSKTLTKAPHITQNRERINATFSTFTDCLETCRLFADFLNDHQGHKLMTIDEQMHISDDDHDGAPGSIKTKTNNRYKLYGRRHPHYMHCIKFHSDDSGDCDAGNNCLWQTQTQSEAYKIHNHFFHNVPMQLDMTLIRERRQRFSINSKRKYKTKLSSLLHNHESHSGQLEFGYKYEIKSTHAKFRNPKQEILQNEYHRLSIKQWNDLLRKSVYYMKKPEAKRMILGMKEVVSVKLYTDFDALQREFRKCFRQKERIQRIKRQKSFYFWYQQLTNASNKSYHIIPNKLYHGVNIALPPSTFCGVYHGPVSTTMEWEVATGFAGSEGQVIELYPSFGKKGFPVSFLSNFPEEAEVLYIDCSFQISNIYKPDKDGKIYRSNAVMKVMEHETGATSMEFIEHCMLKAMQMMSVDSQVISLNYSFNGKQTGFSALQPAEKISILYVLHLHYHAEGWQAFLSPNATEHTQVAMSKYRDMFVSLASNVKAVKMEKLSKLLQIFFCTPQKDYSFPFRSAFAVTDTDIKNALLSFEPNQKLCFETVCLLFPNAEQISINANNWDFSLNSFIGFLEIFDFDDASVALQDIYIRFVNEDSGKILSNDQRARKLRDKSHSFKRNLRELRRCGWAFVTASHLHRVGFQPLPELPFLRLFVAPQKELQPPMLFRAYSSRFSIASYLSTLAFDLNEMNEGKDEDEGVEIGELHDDAKDGIILVDHNPKNCILSNDIFASLEYKNKLIKLLKWRRDNPHSVGINTTKYQSVFKNACLKVEVLVLDPLPAELEDMFYKNSHQMQPGCMHKRRKKISFAKICHIFPNVQDVFLRRTTFSLTLCWDFKRFMAKEKTQNTKVNLERIFFSQENPMKYTDHHLIKQQLLGINWDFSPKQQTVFRRSHKMLSVEND